MSTLQGGMHIIIVVIKPACLFDSHSIGWFLECVTPNGLWLL